MKFPATTESSSAAGLASDLVRECLGFHASPRENRPRRSEKLDALLRVRASLRSCFDDGDNDDNEDNEDNEDNDENDNNGNNDDNDDNYNNEYCDASVDGEGGAASSRRWRRSRHRLEWRAFLEGRSPEAEGDGFDDDPSEDSLLRDGLIRCLAEGCRRSGNDDDTIEGGDEDVRSDVVESSLICLTQLVCLRCDAWEGKSSALRAPIFGHGFVAAVAADVAEALRSPSDPPAARAASGLLLALLRPDRPRNEACLPAVRDSVLLPACGAPGSSPAGSPAAALVARVLCRSVVVAVGISVPGTASMDAEELSIRRETAALSGLQDMRDVLVCVGLACYRGLGHDEAGAGGGARSPPGPCSPCSREILLALQKVYNIAAFAVESQLETLLGADKAMAILSRLSREGSNQGEGKLMGDVVAAGGVPTAAAVGNGGDGGSRRTLEEEDDHDTIIEDGKEAKLEEATTLAPLYADMPKPAVFLTTFKDLESTLASIAERLAYVESSRWDERLDALVDLERVMAGGVADMGRDARRLLVEGLRSMPLPDQFRDLRSQITGQACRVLLAASHELRGHVASDAALNAATSQLVERCVFPSVLDLCKSGTRLMAEQGLRCLLRLNASCGGLGYPRTVPRYCEQVLGDAKVHKNLKMGGVMALTAALRVWGNPGGGGDPNDCFARHLDLLVKATREATTGRDPTVREEGRKLYWAMHARCDRTRKGVQGMFDEGSREMKNLTKEREDIDSEWEEGTGVMSVLVRTGVLGVKVPRKKDARRQKSSRIPPPGASGARRTAGSRFRAEHGTPFKSQPASTW